MIRIQGRGGIGVGSVGPGVWWVLGHGSLEGEVSDTMQQSTCPKYGPYGATGRPAMTKHRRTLSHVMRPHSYKLPRAIPTNESPLARAAFRQATLIDARLFGRWHAA